MFSVLVVRRLQLPSLGSTARLEPRPPGRTALCDLDGERPLVAVTRFRRHLPHVDPTPPHAGREAAGRAVAL